MKNKKAQAAMEFLTTYGWALLIMAVVLGGLGYLGVFSPGTYVKSNCQLDAGLACPVFSAYYDGTDYILEMAIQNNLNDRVEIDKLVLVNPQDDTSTCMDETPKLISGGVPLLASYSQDQQRDVRFNFGPCTLLADGLDTKQRYDMKLYYKKGDATMPSVTAGKLITVVDDQTV